MLSHISVLDTHKTEEMKELLHEQGLQWEEDIDTSIGITERKTLAAVGSLAGRVIKCVAVRDAYQGEGLMNKLVSHLVMEAYYRGMDHLFVFTKPIYARQFRDQGFYPIEQVDDTVVLLENKKHGLSSYLEKLAEKRIVPGKIASGEKAENSAASASAVPGKQARIASLVMNCNPFTNGHLYLVEKTAAENEHVHLFVVEEDRSYFPFPVRLRLVREGTAHLDNVTVHPGGDYIISLATFPSYFLKDSKKIIAAHSRLDLALFGDKIAPVLGLTHRYIGEEPYCPVTRRYNEDMKRILPEYGIEVIEVPRKTGAAFTASEGTSDEVSVGASAEASDTASADASKEKEAAISASTVRSALAAEEHEILKSLVPETTMAFLLSDEAEPIIGAIRGERNDD
ncbi:MAG: [citrate (pro-3S)-lyase] ligase [Spirochaetales bacterium]|nr:[citrate (pro-3S)-lyase] ligase [Spirochaetales bacterium]